MKLCYGIDIAYHGSTYTKPYVYLSICAVHSLNHKDGRVRLCMWNTDRGMLCVNCLRTVSDAEGMVFRSVAILI